VLKHPGSDYSFRTVVDVAKTPNYPIVDSNESSVSDVNRELT
jgi:hypothetical protein